MSLFRSKSQMAYLYANHPDIAKRWSKEFPDQNTKKLTEHVKKSKVKVKQKVGKKNKLKTRKIR
jgi:hypothetical protein